MAQRKSPPRLTKPATSNKPAAPAKTATQPATRPAAKKPGKSIINQKQTPWGLITTTAVIVLFAAAIIAYVVATHKSTPAANGGCSAMIGNNSTSYLNQLTCAADIKGVTFTPEPNRTHEAGVLQYDASPPVGGNHAPIWGDCSGTVYPNPIANENAVHMLEHGAVWITYRPGLAATDVATLSSLVSGHDRLAMSPYPGLNAPISIQSWGYQLRVSSATDPRLATFIAALRYNPKTTPEYGATCSDPYFLKHESTPGHPLDS